MVIKKLRMRKVIFNREEVRIFNDIAIEFHRKKEYHAISKLVSQNKELVPEFIENSNNYKVLFKWLKA